MVESKDGAEVLISEGDQGESAAQKLCETISVANTKVAVSPDDGWIVVQSGGASLGVSLAVFRHQKGMIYEAQPKLDISSAVLKQALDNDAAAVEKLDHVYANLIAWSANSKSILVSVGGRGGSKKVDPYFAIFDLAKQSIGFDLESFNRKPAGH